MLGNGFWEFLLYWLDNFMDGNRVTPAFTRAFAFSLCFSWGKIRPLDFPFEPALSIYPLFYPLCCWFTEWNCRTFPVNVSLEKYSFAPQTTFSSVCYVYINIRSNSSPRFFESRVQFPFLHHFHLGCGCICATEHRTRDFLNRLGINYMRHFTSDNWQCR